MSYKRNGVEFRLDAPGIEQGDLYHYQAFTSGNVDRAELRKEYSRLRKVANDRLSRMEGTRFENYQSYRRNAGKYITLEAIEKEALAKTVNMTPEAAQRYVDSQVAKKMSDLYRFLTAKTGNIRGIQAMENQMIEAFRDRGIDFINKGNIQQFGEYMEYLRILHHGKQYGSERALTLFGLASKKGIDPVQIAQDFEYWKNHEAELASTPRIKNASNRTAEAYKAIIEKNRR